MRQSAPKGKNLSGLRSNLRQELGPDGEVEFAQGEARVAQGEVARDFQAPTLDQSENLRGATGVPLRSAALAAAALVSRGSAREGVPDAGEAKALEVPHVGSGELCHPVLKQCQGQPGVKEPPVGEPGAGGDLPQLVVQPLAVGWETGNTPPRMLPPGLNHRHSLRW